MTALPVVGPASGDWVTMPSGLTVPQATARQVAHRSRRPIAIDLFCGCGGFSLGMIQAGFEVVAGLDNEPWSALTYLLNLGTYPVQINYGEPKDKDRLDKVCEKSMSHKGRLLKPVVSGGARPPGQPGVSHFFFGDVRKFTGDQILAAIGRKQGEVDCVCGGPPCQGFSHAGRRNVMDPRNSLVFEFARLVLEIQPKSLIMENVPGILSMVTPEGIPVMDALCRVLEDGGFGGFDALRRGLLASAGCGAAVRGKKPDKPTRRPRAESAGLFDDADEDRFEEDAAGV